MPETYDQLQGLLGERVSTARLASRTVDEEIVMEPGYYSCVPKIDATGIGFYVRIFGPPDADLHVWRFSDGQTSALNILHGVTAASTIPVVIAPVNPAPTPGVQPAVPTPAAPVVPTPAPAPVQPAAVVPPTLLKTLGVDDTGLSKLLRKVFTEADTLNRGQLDKSASKKSLASIFDNEKFALSFNKFWGEAEAASGTSSKYLGARLDFNKFEVVARKTLSEFFK
jgi:hypothetical protein